MEGQGAGFRNKKDGNWVFHMREVVEKTINNCEAVEQQVKQTQTSTYDRLLSEWQKQDGAAFSLPQIVQEKRPTTFVEGKGFHAVTPPAVEEKKALGRIFAVIGKAMLAYLGIEYVLSFAVVQVLQLLHVDVTYYYDSGYICGNVWAVLLMLFIVKVVKYLVPIWILHRSFRMPKKVAVSLRPVQPMAMVQGIPLVMVAFAVMNLWRGINAYNMIRYSSIGTALQMLTYASRPYQVIYFFFDLILVTALVNLLFRAEILQVLRQFGDEFAVLVTSLLGVVMFHDAPAAPTLFLVYVICGCATLQSGSLWAGILNLFVYRLLLFSLFHFEYLGGIWEKGKLIYLLILLAIGLAWTGIALAHRWIRKLPRSSPTSLKEKEKWQVILQDGSLMVVTLLCLVLAVISFIF